MTTYIFTIPPESPERNCSGPVVVIEYCHVSNIYSWRRQNIFTLFLLSRDGEVFTIESEYEIGIISDSSCMDRSPNSPRKVCCNKQNLINDMLLSEANVIFGVQVGAFELLTFSSSTFEYKYPQLLGSFRRINARTSFTRMEVDEVDDQSLLLLRFYIESQGMLSLSHTHTRNTVNINLQVVIGFKQTVGELRLSLWLHEFMDCPSAHKKLVISM